MASYNSASSQDSNAMTSGFNYDGVDIPGLGSAASGVNFNSSNSSLNPNDPASIYKATNGLGNSIVPMNFGEITLNLPAWQYHTEDGNTGLGVLTFSTFQGKTATHHLYRDISNGTQGGWFYVTRHGKNNGHGVESSDRAQLPWSMGATAANGMAVPPRAIADATVGTDDSYESGSDPYRMNAAVIHISNPHLSREDYMNCVYPHYDNPAGKMLSLNTVQHTFLNETVDDPAYTPYEDSTSNSSPTSGAEQNSNSGSTKSKSTSSK